VPLYEYECRKCGHRFETIQTFSDKPIRKCPKCRTGTVKKLISSPAVHFKGSGWYVTDYARKGSAPAGSGGEDSGGKDGKDSKESKESSEKKNDKGGGKSETKSADKGGSGKKADKKD
jgi:putative FmdB family regulatory protein